MLLENTISKEKKEKLSNILAEMGKDIELLEHCKQNLGDYCYYTEREGGIAFNVNFSSKIVRSEVRKANSYERQWGINTVQSDDYIDIVEYDRAKPDALELYKLINGIIKYNRISNIDAITSKYNILESDIISVKNQLEAAKMDMCNNPNDFNVEKAITISQLSKKHRDLISNPLLSYYSKAVSIFTEAEELTNKTTLGIEGPRLALLNN